MNEQKTRCSQCNTELTAEEKEYLGTYCNECEGKDYTEWLEADEQEFKMNEQNKKDAEIHDMIIDALRVDAGDGYSAHPEMIKILQKAKDALNPKPDHPCNGEIVEYGTTNFPGHFIIGYAFKDGIYGDKKGNSPSSVPWEGIISWKISTPLKPGEIAVKIPPVEEWPDQAENVHIEVEYRSSNYYCPLISDITITRTKAKELYKDR